MSLLESWMQTPGATAIVWTLLHSLWQGAIVALLLALVLCTLRGARARYTAACVALVVLLAGFSLTFATVLMREQNLRAASTRHQAVRFAPLDPDSGALAGIRASRGIAGYLPWLAPFWISGVLAFHLRSLAAWMRARRLSRTGVCCAPAPWQERLDRLAARLQIPPGVRLWESCLAEVPLVIGFLRPVVLMPLGLLAGLPAAQVEALLLHELAHIRRYDYLVNLLQVFVEGLIFYHPAVWWIASVIRAERENCCDDLVVAAQGDAYQYASALAALEQNRGDAHQAALAATGGNLVKRIRRLLSQPETPRSPLTPVLSAAILTITLVAVLAAWQTKPAASALPAPQSATFLAPVQQGPDALPAESPYRKWLNEDVAYIISDAERGAFQRLQTNEEREFFITQFWLRRDPTPGTPENEMKEEHYRRIASANQQFADARLPGWKTDRGRIYITYGPPDEKESHPSGGSYRQPAQQGGVVINTVPFEQWRYRFIEGVGTNVIIEFVDPTKTGEYHMTLDPSEKNAALLAPREGVNRAVTVQVLGSSAVISIPLGSHRGHTVAITGQIFSPAGTLITTFEDSIQPPTPDYVKTIPLALGPYRLEVVVKDLSTGSAIRGAVPAVDFEIK